VKIGTENKAKTIAAGALLLLAVIMLYRWIRGDDETPVPMPTASTTRIPATGTTPATRKSGSNPSVKSTHLLAQTLDPTLRFDLLKASEEVSYKGSGRDIFRSQPEPVAIPKPLPPDQQPGYQPPPPPPPPPSGLKFYGFAGRKDGYKRIFLSKGEDIFVAKEGDIVNRRYKVVRISPNSVEVEDVLTNNHETLPLLAG
jgi:hypothetical protein